MVKSLLTAGILAFSGFTYAADIQNTEYLLFVKDKHDKIWDYTQLEAGKLSETYVGTMKPDNKISECDSYINPDFPYPVKLYDATNDGTGITLHTISQNKETFHIVLTVTYVEDFNTENSIKLNDKCTIANSVTSSIEINWAGDVSVGRTETIKLPNNNELYLKVSAGYPDEAHKF